MKKLTASALFSNHDALHYPDFGLALYWRYEDEFVNVDRIFMSKPQVGVAKSSQFIGWLPFVKNWIVQ